jgi:hypothetical protein
VCSSLPPCRRGCGRQAEQERVLPVCVPAESAWQNSWERPPTAIAESTAGMTPSPTSLYLFFFPQGNIATYRISYADCRFETREFCLSCIWLEALAKPPGAFNCRCCCFSHNLSSHILFLCSSGLFSFVCLVCRSTLFLGTSTLVKYRILLGERRERQTDNEIYHGSHVDSCLSHPCKVSNVPNEMSPRGAYLSLPLLW